MVFLQRRLHFNGWGMSDVTRGGQFKRGGGEGENREMAMLMEGELSCYRGGQLERKWSCYRGGQFNGLSMVITEVAILMEGE